MISHDLRASLPLHVTISPQLRKNLNGLIDPWLRRLEATAEGSHIIYFTFRLLFFSSEQILCSYVALFLSHTLTQQMFDVYAFGMSS